MKKINIAIFAASAAILFAACGGKQINPGKALKKSIDSFSYTLGYQVGSYLKGNGVKKIDYSALAKGIEEAINKDSGFAISPKDMQKVHGAYLTMEKEKNSKALKEAAKKWLAENSKKEGVTPLTPSNTYFKMIKKGDGAIPNSWDTVETWLKVSNANGKVMYDSRERQPVPVRSTLADLGATPMIKEAFEKAPAGSVFEVYVPMDASSPLAQFANSYEESFGVGIFRFEFIKLVPGKKGAEAPPAEPAQIPGMK